MSFFLVPTRNHWESLLVPTPDLFLHLHLHKTAILQIEATENLTYVSFNCSFPQDSLLSLCCWSRYLIIGNTFHYFSSCCSGINTLGIGSLEFAFLIFGPGLPWWVRSKESACNVGAKRDSDSILGLGRTPGKGCGNLLQHSCQENPMDRGAWQGTVHGFTKNQTHLSD